MYTFSFRRFTWVCHSLAAAAAHPLEFEVSRCRTSQFVRCFLPAQFWMWNDLPYTVFNTRKLDMVSIQQSTVGCFPELCFLQLSVAKVLVGLRNQFINSFVFHTWACDAGFNYYNYNLGVNSLYLGLIQITVGCKPNSMSCMVPFLSICTIFNILFEHHWILFSQLLLYFYQ